MPKFVSDLRVNLFYVLECMKKPSVNFLFSEIFWYVEFSESKKVKKIHCTFVAREQIGNLSQIGNIGISQSWKLLNFFLSVRAQF